MLQLASGSAVTQLFGYHPVGTCRFGAGIGDGAVDRNPSAFGPRGVRVADASAMPSLPNGNTQAATFVVAEAACEAMLRDAARSSKLCIP